VLLVISVIVVVVVLSSLEVVVHSTGIGPKEYLPMALRQFNLRYLAVKFAASAEEVVAQMQSSAHISFTEALAKGMERFQNRMTTVGVLTGAAMSPTLNPAGVVEPTSMERFLLRKIPRPVACRTVFDGDVVAFTSPLSHPGGSAGETGAAEKHVMVRRIAALEGDEMVSDDPEDESFVIPKDHAWVVADNEGMSAREAVDSRVFGPLPMDCILGRVMYAARSTQDHGFVENSDQGMEADVPVLEAELDIERMFPAAAAAGGGSQSEDDNGGAHR